MTDVHDGTRSDATDQDPGQGADRDVLRAWVDGWVLSRGASAPVEEPWGFRIEVGRPNHVRRYVLPTADPAVLRELASTIDTPGAWLKVCAPADAVAPLLTDGWSIPTDEYLMATALRPTEAAPPAGYSVRSTTTGGITEVQVLAADGETAATGRIASTGSTAVFDQISTDPAHQRRGLGRLMMASLGNSAAARGATMAVLGASREGRELYLALGWTLHSPLTPAVFRPPSAA
ncbi:GNAT family N-acetyltransferase [Solihabitans fulvus]|uniref:GNAT family N-acetyltransferase n=1 Tax=Solihabitans fulvus TaxID=1892852 RepID=A0A5B2XE80_9PSEU|nr:GNAT family N-acetyltransferase [Solihabitans fulvus]KAA2261250.1 GNAT family N-acetyltransferase [Solihabitans fulvus]